MENAANDYLNKLVNRSVLQVVERSRNGEVHTCRMHDIIGILALAKSNEECFSRVYDGSGDFLAEGPRRLSIQSSNLNQLSRSNVPHLRHLYIFGTDLSIDLLAPFLKSLKFLSSLDLQGVDIKSLPDVVFNLYNLRFLGLRDTKIETIKRSIGRLRQLEVLDACNTKLTTLPKEIVQLKKLLFLNVDTIPEEADRRVVLFGGIRLPTGIQYLSRLQALQLVQASTETLPHLGSLTQLRTFAFSKMRNEHCADLCNAIMKMSHLVHLKIKAIDEKEILQLEAFRLPSGLSNLSLGGQLSGKSLPHIILSQESSSNLTRLTLIFSKLSEDSFSCLLNLHSLRVLYLLKAYEGNTLYFPATSFPKLKRLSIWDAPCLNKVEIEQGAMLNLVKLLILRDLPNLKTLPHGIEHLRILEELELRDTSEELIDKLQQKEPAIVCEAHKRIEHIKRVSIHGSQKNVESNGRLQVSC